MTDTARQSGAGSPGQLPCRDGALPALPIADVDVVSIDVFDTAITRILEAPVDVFALLEQRLASSLRLSAKGFATLRERAEEEARHLAREAGREEVTLTEIYHRLGDMRPDLQRHAESILADELATEESVIRPVPEMVDFVRSARGFGHRVVFVSDMYLPRTAIERLLHVCGYDTHDGILVSAETGRTKWSGSQWAVLRDLVGIDARILHIGDDEWSDVGSPQRHGIGGWLFAAAKSDRRPGGPLAPATLPFSRRARAVNLAARRGGSPITPASHPDRFSEFMRGFGESWGAVVLGAFVRWLEARVRQHRLTHLLFCARDGWLPYRVWQAAGCQTRTGIEASYVYVSRRSLNLAEAAMDTGRGQLSDASLMRLGAGDLPVQTLLARSGLLRCHALVADAVREFGGLEQRVASPDGTARFRALLIRHQREVLEALQPFLAAAEGYVHAAAPATGRVGVVDIGWHGTLQSSLARLLARRATRPVLFGMYFGLWPRAQRLRPVTGWMEGCFTNDFRPFEEQSGLHNAVALLENLNLAPHGSTMGYRLVGGVWTPLLQEVDEVQHRTLIAPFQDATVDTVARLFVEGSKTAVEELDPRAGLAAIERVALSPTHEERVVLGAIRHASEFDHSQFRPLVMPLEPNEVPPWPGATDWALGNALAWQETARTATNPAWRELVFARTRSVVARLDARTARQFA